MAPVTNRRLVAAAALCFLATAQPALAGSPGHSRLVPLPTILPPPPLAQPAPMQWARVPQAARARLTVASFENGRGVVGLAGGVDADDFARSLGLRIVTRLTALRAIEVAAPPRTLAAVAERHDSRIRYVDPVHTLRPAHVRNDPWTYQLDPRTGAPYQWAFHSVGLDQALNLAKGDPRILVGVVDSGVTIVRDLQGKVAETFWDPAIQTTAADTIGHGTFVSSIIAARNDDGFGLAGFCGACRVAVFKALPLTDVQIALGIQTLTDAHVRIINVSIISQTVSQNIIDAINYAMGAGVLVIAASGNEGFATIDFPASHVQPPGGVAVGGLSVGAVDSRGNRAPFSNFGTQLSLVAPGAFDARCSVGIIGALPSIATQFDRGTACDTTLTDPKGNRYAYASGTSFAAPEVAGIAALLWSVRPELTSVEIARLLQETARRPPGAGWNTTLGWGIVDAKAAVERLTGAASTDALSLAGLRILGGRTAGSALTASVRATWGDEMTVDIGATPRCRITVRGKTIATRSSVRAGLFTCAFTLPKGSGGAPVAGRLTLSAPATPAAVASFAFAARPPPGR